MLIKAASEEADDDKVKDAKGSRRREDNRADNDGRTRRRGPRLDDEAVSSGSYVWLGVGLGAGVLLAGAALLFFLLRGREAEQPPGAPPPVKNRNGLDIEGPLACGKTAHMYQVGNAFDFARSWALSLEFLPIDVGPEQMLLLWGDERPGRDAIYIRIFAGKMEVAIADTEANGWHTLVAPIDPAMTNKWVPLRIQYDAKTNEGALWLESRLEKKEKLIVVPKLDRPMPVWIGGADATNRLFQGSVRAVRLGND